VSLYTAFTASIFYHFFTKLDSTSSVPNFTLTLPMIWQLTLAALGVLSFGIHLRIHHRRTNHLLLGFAVLFWWTMLANFLNLHSMQWYFQPLYWYLIAFVASRYQQKNITRDHYCAAIFAFIGSALFWHLGGSSGDFSPLIADTLTLITGLVCLLAGYHWKNFSLKVVAAIITTCAVLSQTASYLLQIPWWVWLALLGISILIWATKQLAKKK
jgi:Ca2+/Na+ antiporter